MDGMEEIFAEFLIEANEVLDQFDSDMVSLEKDPSSRPLLDRIFRGIHTMKGTSGVLGLDKLVSISHVGETLLSKMRDGNMKLDPNSTTLLLAMSDALRQIIACFAQSGTEGDGDFSALVASLGGLLEQADTKVELAAPVAIVDPARLSNQPSDPAPVRAAERPAHVPASPPTPPVEEHATQLPAGRSHESQQSAPVEAASNTIRVDVGLLDKLMNMVGELVLARNQILQFSGTAASTGITSAVQRLNLITAELQNGVMKTRMQPIGTIWHKLPRVLRDLAVGCGKEVELVMEGAETELDRTILEAIKDPLTHIIRNAVDHGIELPDVRKLKGKTSTGTLVLRAYHEGGKVNIEIRDDGAGINLEAVKQKTLDRKLASPAEIARMSERELLALVFQPGFSTAKEVTNISGRGVGMDVVKTNIAKIGGTVDLQSTPGSGTTLKIKIPLTLAIIPALIITSASNRFAIPQVSLLELVRLEGGAAAKAIEFIHSSPFYRLRGVLLPIVYLNRQLCANDGTGLAASDVINIVVLQADDRPFGLVVDEVNDSEEIVVKPLGNLLKSLHCFAGATIMGDGRVALILDVMGLAHGAGVLGEQRTRSMNVAVQKAVIKDQTDEWLIVEADSKNHLALPLATVDRLEEFPASIIEWSGNRRVVQYRGEIMPVIVVGEILGTASPVESSGLLQIVVVSSAGRRFGLVVQSITDIVDAHINIDRSSRTRFLRGSAVIEKRVADVMDIDGIVGAALRNIEALESVAS